MALCRGPQSEPQQEDYRDRDHKLRQRLLNIYKAKRNTDAGYDPPTLLLIDCLGGIDVVMDLMLSNDHYGVNLADCAEMEKHLCTPSITKIIAQTSADETSTVDQTLKDNDCKYMLDKNDNALFSLTPLISQYLYSKRAVGLMAIMVILPHLMGITVSILSREEARKLYTLYSLTVIICLWTYPIPWIGAALLSVNRQLWPCILRNLDMWIIVGTALTGFIYHAVVRWLREDSDLYYIVILFHLTWAAFFLPFFVLCCSVDGVHGWRRNSKICLMIGMALICALGSYNWEVHMDDVVVHITVLGEYAHISMANRISYSLWIMSLFFGKFAVNAWRKGDNRCIVLKNSPVILWTEQTTSQDQNQTTPVMPDRKDDGAVSQEQIYIDLADIKSLSHTEDIVIQTESDSENAEC